MWNIKVNDKRQTHVDESDDEFHHERTCMSCMAKELGISEHEANVQIKEQGGPAVFA